MAIQTARQVTLMWAGAITIAVVSAYASIALSPATPPSGPPASYYVGLIGLVAIGVALWLTWGWLNRMGPRTGSMRLLLRTLLVIGGILWLAAMLFPFL